MTNKEFFCPKCEYKAFPIKLEHNPKKLEFNIVLKCPKHKTKTTIPEDELESIFEPLYESTYTCPECGAEYPEYHQIEDIMSFGMSYNAYLILKKRCESCKKNTNLEFSNIIIPAYYNSFYNFLKTKATPETLEEYENVLDCPKCNEKSVLDIIFVKNGKGYIEGRCTGEKSHKFKKFLPLDDQYSWLSYMPEGINVCKRCKSTDLLLKKIDFKFKSGFSTAYINKRNIVNICKNCGYENVVPIHYGLYEVYRRILQEKQPPVTGKGELTCQKCGTEALLEEVQLHSKEIRAVLLCKNRHKTVLSLNEDEKSEWINDLLSGILFCSNCWSQNLKIYKIEPKIEYGGMNKFRKSKITFKCLDCNKKRSITINNVVFDDVIDYLYK